MSRSQRHKIYIQNTSTRGEIYAEGIVAPGVLRQTPPPVSNVIGAGGPLKGSTTLGAVPVGWVVPVPHDTMSGLQPAPLSAQVSTSTPPPAPGGRTFPIGPLNLLRVDPSESPVGVWYVLSKDDGMQLVEGDDVTIEATGATATNGNYTVAQLQESPTERRFFVPDTVIPATIDAKGRVIVTDGAI